MTTGLAGVARVTGGLLGLGWVMAIGIGCMWDEQPRRVAPATIGRAADRISSASLRR